MQPFGHNTPSDITERQDRTDIQWSDRIGRTILQTVAQHSDIHIQGIMICRTKPKPV